mgnify:CR=1 FL=1
MVGGIEIEAGGVNKAYNFTTEGPGTDFVAAPEDLKRQFAQCRRFTRALGLLECAHPRYEAEFRRVTERSVQPDSGEAATA